MLDSDRFEFSKWLLDRNIAWVAFAEAKVGFVVAINTAMIAGLAAAYGEAKIVEFFAATVALVTVALSISSVVCAAMAVLSRTDGPDSLLFFAKIAVKSQAEYCKALRESISTQLLDDFAQQIHKNAQIAATKFVWVRRSMWLAFFSGAMWVLAIALLINT